MGNSGTDLRGVPGAGTICMPPPSSLIWCYLKARTFDMVEGQHHSVSLTFTVHRKMQIFYEASVEAERNSCL